MLPIPPASPAAAAASLRYPTGAVFHEGGSTSGRLSTSFEAGGLKPPPPPLPPSLPPPLEHTRRESRPNEYWSPKTGGTSLNLSRSTVPHAVRSSVSGCPDPAPSAAGAGPSEASAQGRSLDPGSAERPATSKTGGAVPGGEQRASLARCCSASVHQDHRHGS